MTSNRPTNSVRLAALERLAKANRDDENPDSMDFAPTSWSELERTSFTDGVNDLLAYQEARVAEEEQRKVEEVRQQALRRTLQRAKARKWEAELIEKQRREDVERRVEEARARAAAAAEDLLVERRAELDTQLAQQVYSDAFERELTEVSVQRCKRRWGLAIQSTLAAAALGCVVWVSAMSQARTDAGDALAAQRDIAADEAMAAHTRVAELQAEIDRRVSMTESERGLLESQLKQAELELAEAEKAQEEAKRRRTTTPRKWAKAIVPMKPAAVKKTTDGSTKSTTDSVKVAADEALSEGCLPYDPLCFEL